MFGRKISALALLLSCASAPLQASVDPALNRDCWDEQELEALKVQRFKTMLLVSMLNCRDIEPAIAADYNRFVRANRDLIARNQATVRQRFIRSHGPAAGLRAYSDFETALGNRYSDADYDYRRCAAAADDARLAGYVSEPGLMDLVQSMPNEDRFATCAPAPRFASRQWAPPQPPIYNAPTPEVAAPPPPSPMPERAAEPAVQVAVAQNEWPDLAPVEPEGPAQSVDPNAARAEPVQVAAVEAPKVDRMTAVREAAKALREALAALEAEEVATK